MAYYVQTSPPLFRMSHIHQPRWLKVDRPPSISGRSLEIVVLRASFSLVCVSPRNCGWHSNSQLAGTLLAIHGQQQCPTSGTRGTVCQMEGTTHYWAVRLAAGQGSPLMSRRIPAQNWLREIEQPFGLLSYSQVPPTGQYHCDGIGQSEGSLKEPTLGDKESGNILRLVRAPTEAEFSSRPRTPAGI